MWTRQDSNLQPVVYKTTALPIELRVHRSTYYFNFLLTASFKTTALPIELQAHNYLSILLDSRRSLHPKRMAGNADGYLSIYS